jgi:hypothetical protein
MKRLPILLPRPIFVWVCCLLIVGCSHRNQIIPQKKFVPLLVDIHLADALWIQSNQNTTGVAYDSSSLFGSVFEKHHVTRAMFDSTMQYYALHPDEFQKVYSLALDRIKKMQDENTKGMFQEQEDSTKMRPREITE